MTDLDAARLAAAKLWLTSPAARDARTGDAPYLTSAVYALVTVPSPLVHDLAVDENWRLYVNPGWLDRTPTPDVGARLAHVTYHLLLDHAGRARSLSVGRRESQHWTTAADLVVAECLDQAGLDRLGAPLPDELHLPPSRSAEQWYAMLSRLPVTSASSAADADPDDADRVDADGGDADQDDGNRADAAPADPPDGCGGCGSGADGVSRPYEAPAGDAVPRIETVRAGEIRRAVAIAWSGERLRRGTVPGEWRRWVQQVLDPIVAWEPVLTAAVRRALAWASGRADYTYRRPSRRQSAVPGVVLPGMQRPVPEVAVVVDTSGSVDDGLLASALGEVDGVLRGLGGASSSVRLLATDAAVHSLQRVRRGRDADLTGGGGTDLGHGLLAAAALRPRCDVCIVLTDGGTPWPPHPPAGMAVVVGVLGRDRAALPPTPRWATRVECVHDRGNDYWAGGG